MPMFNRLFSSCMLLLGAILMISPAFAASNTVPFNVSNAWIRWLPGDLPLAGYATFRNDTAKPVKLVSASSPVFQRIEFHHSMDMSGMSHMMHVDSVTIPAQGTFQFKPGSWHMMMWRKKDIQPGDTVTVTFKFADGRIIAMRFEVKGATGQ